MFSSALRLQFFGPTMPQRPISFLNLALRDDSSGSTLLPQDLPTAVSRAREAITSFHPDAQPLHSRRSYWLEVVTTFFFAMTLMVIDGNVVAVFTKQTFDGVIAVATLNLLVAVLGATSELANLLSFFWGSLGQGRPKVRLINALQLAVIAATALIAFLPQTPVGLYGLVAAVIVARVCWSGILTLRPTLWRANYGPAVRSRIVGQIQTVQMLIIALGGAAIGYTLDRLDPSVYRTIVPFACGLGLIGVLTYSRLKVRGERAMLARERASTLMRFWDGPIVMWRILKRDPRYAQFMGCLFVLGFGNIMVGPVLVITLREHFNQGYFQSILIASSVTNLVIPFAIPLWVRLMDRAHVVRFRSVQSWTFVVSSMCFLAGAYFHILPLMFAGAVVQGVAFAGGNLAWHLGHVDFAPPAETSHYMATHVTLNGLRGLIAPFAAVALYEAARAAGLNPSVALFGIILSITLAGCFGFLWLYHSMGKAAQSKGAR
jgi:MFS family permease